MPPELSIIVPCYNYARYLPDSVDSILNQDYRDYELILIDDGSSDDTWQIIQNYAAKHSHVKAFKNDQNQGIFKVNAQGWEHAQGKYLHFFSADDLYQPSCLAKVMQLFHQNPSLGLVCTDIGYFQDGARSQTVKQLLPACQKPRLFTAHETIPLFQTTDFWVPGLTCIVRQDILKKYGHLEPGLENISDWFCFHKIALYEGIGYIPETLISMRQHGETYTSRVKKDKNRRRATYRYLLKMLDQDKSTREQFKKAGLLDFIFRELYWQLRFHPRYLSFWPYLRGHGK